MLSLGDSPSPATPIPRQLAGPLALTLSQDITHQEIGLSVTPAEASGHQARAAAVFASSAVHFEASSRRPTCVRHTSQAEQGCRVAAGPAPTQELSKRYRLCCDL